MVSRSDPRLFWPTVLLLGAALCVVMAHLERDWPELRRLALVAIGAVLALIGVLMLLDWIVYRASVHHYHLAQSAAVTPASKLAAELRGMDAAAVVAICNHLPDPLRLAVIPGPAAFLEIGGERIPYPWLSGEWLAQVDGERLPAIRLFSDSAKRDWCRAINSHLIEIGWADPPDGNQRARLRSNRDWDQVFVLFGFE